MSETIRPQHPFAVKCRACHGSIVWFNVSGNRVPVDESTTKTTDAAHQFDAARHQLHRMHCPGR